MESLGSSGHDDKIPIVDFAKLNQPGGREKLGQELAHVMKTVGFLYVKNHGIPEETINAVFKAARDVFALPYEVKSKRPRSSKFEPSCGYVPFGLEKLDDPKREEIREAYNYIPYNDERLPAEVPEFGMTCKALFWESWTFSKNLLECLAIGLGQKNVSIFADDSHRFMGHPGNFTTLRVHNYPAHSMMAAEAENITRCGAHTDYGTLTVLYQDEVGGLEVETSPGTFVPVVPIPGTVVINIGDIMQRWTSDLLRSTVHAVTFGTQERNEKTRQSIAFFLHPDDDYIVKCLDGSQKYPPISGKEYLREKMTKAFVKYFGDDE